MELATFNMSFYMSKRGVHTIDLIRQGLRRGTTRQYDSEIRLIKSLKHGQPILFNRTDNNDKVVDSIIVFAINNIETNTVGYKVNGWDKDDSLCAKWCELEGWDIDFAKKFLSSNKELWQFEFSLYPPNYAYSPDNITELKDDEVFIYGANTEFRHGAGAAKQALKFGAVCGKVESYQGNTYGIITTDLNEAYRPSVDIQVVKDGVDKFIQFAKDNAQLTFLVTEIGCGLAGFTVEQIASLFKSVLLDKVSNVRLPKSFVRELIVSSIESCLT